MQPVGDRGGRLGVANAFEEDGKLVAAEPRERIPASDACKPLADGNEESVANLVAEAVVDQLEAVEVDEEHGKPCEDARRVFISARSSSSAKSDRLASPVRLS